VYAKNKNFTELTNTPGTGVTIVYRGMVGREQTQVLAVLLQRPALGLVRHRRHLKVKDARRRRLDRAFGDIFVSADAGIFGGIGLYYGQEMRQMQAAGGKFFCDCAWCGKIDRVKFTI
jgi:hypothetical protein